MRGDPNYDRAFARGSDSSSIGERMGESPNINVKSVNFKLDEDDRIKIKGDASVLFEDSHTMSPSMPMKKNQSGLFRISSDKKVE